MAYGYYLACTDSLHGDPEYCLGLRTMFLALEIKGPGKFDGVSRYDARGSVTTQFCIDNWFATKPMTFYFHQVQNE